ncbi:putative ribonuclease H-like domain-containing protein [Tanacetum coccineum]
MTRNKCYLNECKDYYGGFVSFSDGKGRISGKGKIKTESLDFHDVYFCKELKYNLFSMSQICDKKNNVLFTDTECFVLSSNFKLLDESQVLLRATVDESNTWHMRLGHINFKTMNKLVKGNLVKGLPSKIFENDHSCVACQKGKQHKASYKTKLVNSISKPLHLLHMDLFGPTNVKSLMKKSYCLVVTDDFSRFSWVFFLATKDESSGILKTFITEIENQLDHKVKVIRSDNGTEFKNSIMNQFCEIKGIKREFSVARTPQQNGVAERKNRTLIEAARTITHVSTAGPSFNIAAPSTPVNAIGPSVSTADESEEQLFKRFSPFKNAFTLPPVPNIYSMDNTGIFGNAYDDEDVEEEVDMNNVILSYSVPDPSFTKFHKDHHEDQVIGSLKTPVQTRHMTKITEEHVDLPRDKWAIGTKWVFINKKDERDIVVKNKARLVAQGHTQEEGIDYDEVFAPFARIEAIRLFLAYASFKDFVVYQMDVKSAFLYEKIEEEVYVCQPTGFKDPHFPDKVHKVEKALYGLHQCNTLISASCQRKGQLVLRHSTITQTIENDSKRDVLRKFHSFE